MASAFRPRFRCGQILLATLFSLPPPPPPPLPNISLTTAALRASGPERLQSCPARNDNSSGNNNVNSTAADFLPSSLPSSSSLPASFLNSALAMSDAAAARMGSLAPVAAPGLPAGGAYAALSNAVGSTAVIAAAAASGLHAAMAQTATVHVQPRLLQAQQPSSVLVASQLQTPGYSSLREPVRCVAQLGAAGTRVAVRGHSDSQLQLQIIPQQPQQQPQQQQQRGKLRLSSQRRVRPPSPALPAMPSTPPQLGSLGPEDWILHVIKCLGMSEPDTARLSLHCWRRVSELPQLHHATRLWPSAPAGKKLYATACLWVSIKLEEKRRDAPGGVVLSHLAAATPGDLCAAELAVMNWLNWRPYDGPVIAARGRLVVQLLAPLPTTRVPTRESGVVQWERLQRIYIPGHEEETVAMVAGALLNQKAMPTATCEVFTIEEIVFSCQGTLPRFGPPVAAAKKQYMLSTMVRGKQNSLPNEPVASEAGAAAAAAAAAASLQRANSAPPSRMLTYKGRLSIATNSADWGPQPTEPTAAAGGGAVVNGISGTQIIPLEPTPAAAPAGSVVKPYGFLPPPSTPPPLKPRWPTARLVSSRRSAAAAFTSFAAAPTVALRITGLGGTAPTAGTPTKPATPAASAAAPAPQRTQAPADTKTQPPRRFHSHRTRCLADNLAFLHRGNTHNPPLNERISRLLDVVLPPPSPTSLTLHAIPSPMTPPAPVPPPPPEAMAHLDRALQLRREVVVAQRYKADGLAAVADTMTGAVVRWSSRRVGVGGTGTGTGGMPAQGTALPGISVNASGYWKARGADWVDGGGGVGGGGGLGVVLGGITGSISVPLPGVHHRNEGADAVEGVWGLPYMPENDAASAAMASAAAVAASAMRNSSTEALHLQGVSYRAAKAATRALAEVQRPGTSLRMQGPLVLDETPQYPPYLQQHPPNQQDQQQHPPPRQHQQTHPRARSHSHPQPPPTAAPVSIWI
ncbi:hypothetical protein VOLCADRAFT_94316 [Volvox carteri f. nagariensis]|uniref:Uncharacterized protein n=1 Tax=Volvox carteri f. nagariensis TaxID=3068 RepID=D8U465_VOLCA|nr:uncharacterized protein VOLCADRAFT_94316 [Volvox carteri f. nagariensis]EFJ45445.1 hypothetical protein VOLCADRAFT_94316 [Volvox carteri f. nagariensis]|eukprot:XP_002953472.1 hypothetical protein VOLCADRAFT_94316 [Volvox carteri f. nagariensis]